MHTSRDDYLINTLRLVSRKEESQIYRARLPKSMTSPEMRETKAYKTYLGYATRVTPPKKVRKFKNPASLKLSTISASPEKPTRKSKRVKRPAKKSSDVPTTMALTKEAQYEEVRKKSLRDFHKTHPSGSGTVTKITPSAAKIKPSVTNEGTSVKPGVPDVTEEESTESNDQERDSGDDNTQSDSENGSDSEHETNENESGSESDQEENEEEIEDNEEEEEDEFIKPRMDYTTNQFDDDVDLRMNEPITTDEGFNQKEGTDKIEVPVTSSSHSSDLASKFLNFSDIPYIDAEIVSPMDVHVHHERSRKDKDKDEDPSAGSDRGLKKRKTSKDAEPTTDSDMPQDQEENPGNEDEEPKGKEGDFPRLHINDIEDMLILIVQNMLTNLSGDDVSIFAVALQMFTRSMVIQKRVEDLQLGVKSYQKKINVTRPETTRPNIKKRTPYTPYQDP
ncbi:hypothetical protein Tco_0560818 [Tanacetum coccineum]